MKYDLIYRSPIGCLGICLENQGIAGVSWVELGVSDQHCSLASDRFCTSIGGRIISALDGYFESRPIETDVPLYPRGSAFQNRVWQFLKEIPLGSVMTYGEVASSLQTSSRAIGQACRRNGIALFIPCHRVIGVAGIGGFMGGYRHTERKRWLLRHEGIL